MLLEARVRPRIRDTLSESRSAQSLLIRLLSGVRLGISTPLSIANETGFEPLALNRELRLLVYQKAGLIPLWSEVLGSFPEGLAPPAGREAAAPAGPGAGERRGCES